MPAWLLFMIPPVIGSVIGLFTNWLAIKMLFRPLDAVRFMGIRLPFTPGILPRERSRIAQSLAATVADDLLTMDTIETRLRSPVVSAAVRKAIGHYLEDWLEKPIGSLGSLVEGSDTAWLATVVGDAMQSLACSPPFEAGLRAAIARGSADASGLSLAGLLDGPLGQRIITLAASPAAADALTEALANGLAGTLFAAADEGRCIADFVDEHVLRDLIVRLFERWYQPMVRALVSFSAQPAIRASMEQLGAKVLRRALDRFNIFQRFFISLGQYDRAIIDNMPDTINDFIAALELLLSEDTTRDELKERLTTMVMSLATRPLASFDALSQADRRADTVLHVRRLLSVFFGAMDQRSLAAACRKAVGDATLGSLTRAFPDAGDALAVFIIDWLHDVLADGSGVRRGAGAVLSAFGKAFAGTARGLAFGDILGLDSSKLASLTDRLGNLVVNMAIAEAAKILETMDIRSMVVAKIDSLDMIEVERMLLRVIDRELRAVTLFGGILGALIGLVQSSVLFWFK
jgi:hypothetical protein